MNTKNKHFTPGERVRILIDKVDRCGTYVKFDSGEAWPHRVRYDDGYITLLTDQEIEAIPNGVMDAGSGMEAIRALLHEYSIDLPLTASPKQIVEAVRYLGDAWSKAHAEVLRNRTEDNVTRTES